MIVETQQLSEDEKRRKDSVKRTIAVVSLFYAKNTAINMLYNLKLTRGQPQRVVVVLACEAPKTRHPYYQTISYQTIHSTVYYILYGQRTSMIGTCGMETNGKIERHHQASLGIHKCTFRKSFVAHSACMHACEFPLILTSLFDQIVDTSPSF